jgi:hypothetical protein
MSRYIFSTSRQTMPTSAQQLSSMFPISQNMLHNLCKNFLKDDTA